MPSPTCPTNCTEDLPPVAFDGCHPNIVYSEIRRIFQAKRTAASFTNWLAAGEWTTRLSQTSITGDDYIRALTVIADKPAGSPVVKEISNGRKQQIGKDQTLNFTIDDMAPENYDWMRQMECGGSYKWWFETEGGYMYGGNDGFVAELSQIDDILNRGRDEIETIAGVLSWRGKFSPERGVSPIYDGENTTPVPTTFDSQFDFVSDATPTAANGVTATAATTDAEQLFEYNLITPRTGLPMSMSIKVSTVEELTVDFTDDYEGAAFRYTDKAGTVHTGVFTDGDVNF